MIAPEFSMVAEASVPGISVQLRLSPRQPTEVTTWTAPADILTFRCAPAARVWTRPHTSTGGDFTLDGLLTFRPREASWQTRSDGAPQLSLMTRFDRPLKYPGSGSLQVFSIADAGMFALMRMLVEEIRTPGFSSPALIDSIGTILRVRLRRLISPRDIAKTKVFQLDMNRLALINEYIVSQHGRSPNITELADLCRVSPRSLLRMFRARTGFSVAGYIAQVQLEKSKSLLVGTDLKIKQIAFEVGFADPDNFSTSFRRLTGLTPTEFRIAAAH